MLGAYQDLLLGPSCMRSQYDIVRDERVLAHDKAAPYCSSIHWEGHVKPLPTSLSIGSCLGYER